MKHVRKFRCRWQLQQGFGYVEVLIATLLIAITLVPAIEALAPGIQGSKLHKQRAAEHYALQGRLEEMLVTGFDQLDAAATAAGAYTVASSYSVVASPNINVYLWRYDVDNADADSDVFTGGEDDLLWIKVALADDSLSLQTLLSRY